MALDRFDLVVTTPQYGLPMQSNVIEMPLPFAHPKPPIASEIEDFAALWSNLPRPWILAVIGGGKFPLRLGDAELSNFGATVDRLAAQLKGSVLLLDSPRSGEGALQLVSRAIRRPKWLAVRASTTNPYQAALHLADQFAVTSDSVSMITEMLILGPPLHVFKLPSSRLVPRWRARAGLAAMLTRQGILSPPRDVDGLVQGLLARGVVGDLAAQIYPQHKLNVEAIQAAVVRQIKEQLKLSYLKILCQ